jgi:hypothetical protein
MWLIINRKSLEGLKLMAAAARDSQIASYRQAE